MDTHAWTAQLELLPHKETLDALPHQHALEMDNTSVMLQTVTNADNARLDGYQLKTEDHATDQDQHAHAFNNTQKMDMHASTAQLEQLLIKETKTVSKHHNALEMDNT